MAHEYDGPSAMNGSLPDAQPAAVPMKQTYRSFKKKYAKLKVKFELGMRDSEALFREEMRIQHLSIRIQEQNDQLLEVLLEFNDSLYVPPHLRYELSVPGVSSLLPLPSKEGNPPASYDFATAKAALNEARSELASGETSLDAYRSLEEAVKRSETFAPGMQYPSLLQVPHTVPAPASDRFPADGDIESTLGYLTAEREAEYFLTMDARLGDTQAALQLSRTPEKPSFSEREREAALRNPVSVYNWLRRNQPQVFLQDNEIASEKSGSRPANLRSSKRASTQARKEEDVYDEDGVLMDMGPAPGSSRGKRKRDEDIGYRPKGGGSGRGGRKKREDAAYSGRRSSKRSSGVAA